MSKNIAMAFGSFDIIHPGHIQYLRSASRYGKLIVVVARDSSIRKLKGRRPIMDERTRVEMVDSLRFVDKAILGDRIRKWNDIYKILKRFRPDFIVLGYDQKVDMRYLRRFLSENGLKSKVIRVRAYNARRYKSSKLKKLIDSIY
jgi:FAD synthetase